ncbi:MAG: glucokinase, partial [Burkholderiales bacterium]|nr:glucokinase [Burkholderiales bacterium]
MNLTQTFPRLLADVGGTNVRFALIRAAGAPITEERTFPCEDYPGLHEAAKAYIEQVGVQPTWAAIGIATAIAGDFVRMTNLGWQFSQAELKQQLGLDELQVINDFTALA